MWETEGETGSCSDRWGYASKSLIQLMGGAVFPPCCLTWGQTMVEVMKIMAPPSKVALQPFCTQWPQPCSRPPLTHASAGDSWTLMGKSGSVSSGVTAPFSWVQCTQSSVCALQESVSPDCVSSDSNMVGFMVTSSKRAYATPKSAASSHTHVCCTQSPCPCGCPLLTILSDHLAFCWPSVPTILLGLFCPWTLGISSQSLQWFQRQLCASGAAAAWLWRDCLGLSK